MKIVLTCARMLTDRGIPRIPSVIAVSVQVVREEDFFEFRSIDWFPCIFKEGNLEAGAQHCAMQYHIKQFVFHV